MATRASCAPQVRQNCKEESFSHANLFRDVVSSILVARASGQRVMSIPMPEVEEITVVVQITPQVRIDDRPVRQVLRDRVEVVSWVSQVVDLPVSKMLQECVDAVSLMSQEVVQQRTDNHSLDDVPVPQFAAINGADCSFPCAAGRGRPCCGRASSFS